MDEEAAALKVAQRKGNVTKRAIGKAKKAWRDKAIADNKLARARRKLPPKPKAIKRAKTPTDDYFRSLIGGEDVVVEEEEEESEEEVE